MAVNRDSVGVVLIALLAVAGLGLTAATVDSTYSSGFATGGGGGGQNPNTGGGDLGGGDNQGQVPVEDRGNQSPLEIPKICIEILTQPLAIIGVVGSILLIVGLSYRQFGFIGASFVAYLVGLPATLGYGLVTQCGAAAGGPEGSPIAQLLANSPLGQATSYSVPPALLIGIFAVAAVGAVVALISATGSEDIEAPEEEEDEDLDLDEFAAAAGAAADRIESTDASVDNAVYRAWQEMTDLLDIPNPESSTSGEFADAAVEAGMGEEDVGQLTQLFDEVRYGDMDPEPREDLALETLRGIEERYGVDPDAPDAPGEPDDPEDVPGVPDDAREDDEGGEQS